MSISLVALKCCNLGQLPHKFSRKCSILIFKCRLFFFIHVKAVLKNGKGLRLCGFSLGITDVYITFSQIAEKRQLNILTLILGM